MDKYKKNRIENIDKVMLIALAKSLKDNPNSWRTPIGKDRELQLSKLIQGYKQVKKNEF